MQTKSSIGKTKDSLGYFLQIKTDMNEANKCFSGSAVNRYFINQTVCPAFVIIFKVIINHGSLSNLTMVWLDKPKQPRSQEVKKKGTHTH